MHSKLDKKVLMLKPEDIVSSPLATRRVFDTYELDRLSESISSCGIIEPLCVRKNAYGEYELISGVRRLHAAKNAGLRRVPCVVHRTDDITSSIYALTENIQRSDLTFFEEAEAINMILRLGDFSQSELSLRLGMASSTICNKLRLLRLDGQLRERIIAANLTERHARALLQIPNEHRMALLDKIVAEGLNLKQTEQVIHEFLSPKAASKEENNQPVRKAVIGDIRLFANSLSKLVGTLNCAGINASSKRLETDSYIEYKVRIPKERKESRFEQLTFC